MRINHLVAVAHSELLKAETQKVVEEIKYRIQEIVEAKKTVICEAFPNGIPFEIAYGDTSHTEPFPGDHGIRYEPT